MSKYFLILLLLLANSCVKNNVYVNKQYLKNNTWSYAQEMNFTFKVKDTNTAYNFNFLIQHGFKYPNSNIWIKMYVIDPDGKQNYSLQEIPLQLPMGTWMGSIGGGKIEHQWNITPTPDAISVDKAGTIQHVKNIIPTHAPTRFSKPGTYTIKLVQYMRQNPLPDIQYVGLQIVPVLL